MAKHTTHKDSTAAKLVTIERKRRHDAKRTPPLPLSTLARELGVKVVTK